MHLQRHLLTTTITLALVFLIKPSFADPYVSVTGYQITAPAGWTQSKPNTSADVMFTGPVHHKPAPTIQVAVIRLTSPVSSELLSAAGDSIIKGIKSFPSFHLINKEETTIAGQPSESILVTYRATAKGPLLRSWQLFVTHDTQAFLITNVCVASEADELRTAFRAAIQSFNFATANGHRYVSKYGYSFLPIETWTVKPNPEGGSDVYVVEQGGTLFAANMGVRVKEMKEPKSTAESIFANRGEMNAELQNAIPGAQIISQKITTIAGSHAVDTIITATINMDDGKSIPVRMHQTTIPHGNFIYLFTFMGLNARASEQEPQYLRMLTSIQWPTD